MSVGHVIHPGRLAVTVVRRRSVSGRRHSHAQTVSAMAKERSLSSCQRAVAMVKAGMKQAGLAKQFSVSVRSIEMLAVPLPHGSEASEAKLVAEGRRC